jgi:hypothetical protein
MKFQVVRQIAVEAESVDEAINKTKPSEGVTTSINVSAIPEPRPTQKPSQAVSTSGPQ